MNKSTSVVKTKSFEMVSLTADILDTLATASVSVTATLLWFDHANKHGSLPLLIWSLAAILFVALTVMQLRSDAKHVTKLLDNCDEVDTEFRGNSYCVCVQFSESESK